MIVGEKDCVICNKKKRHKVKLIEDLTVCKECYNKIIEMLKDSVEIELGIDIKSAKELKDFLCEITGGIQGLTGGVLN